MRFYQKHYPQAIYEVYYESLIENQVFETKELLHFLALPWQENCLGFHQKDNLVKTASHHQVKEPIYKTSKGQWRHYEPYITNLKEALKDEISAYEKALLRATRRSL